MPASPYPLRHDPELDPDRGSDPRGPSEIGQHHARLLANPFLTMLGWILAFRVMKIGLAGHNPILSLLALIGMLASIPLIQYHCLDCGETGWAFRAKRHRCPRGIARSSADVAGQWAGPMIRTQLKFWFIVASLAAGCSLLIAAAQG